MNKYSVLLLVTLHTLSACVSTQPPKRPLDLPFAKIYEGTFDTVWESTLSVLDIYSITNSNRESGLLITDWMDARNNKALYENPDTPEHLEQVRFRLRIKLSKGLVAQTGAPAVRVQVVKELEDYKNFYLDWQRIPTDQYEEKVILYRISQRLKIAETLKRKSTGSQSTDAPG